MLIHKKYNPDILQQAIVNTFERRKTPYIANHPVFEDEFAENGKMLVKWTSFLTKSTLDTNIRFADVLTVIKVELRPIFELLKGEG